MEKKSPLRPRERTLCAIEPQPNTTRTSVPAHSARNSLTAGLVTRHAPQRVLLGFLMLFILTERRGWCSWHSQAQPRTHYHPAASHYRGWDTAQGQHRGYENTQTLYCTVYMRKIIVYSIFFMNQFPFYTAQKLKSLKVTILDFSTLFGFSSK